MKQQQKGGKFVLVLVTGRFAFLGMEQVQFMAHATSHRFKPIYAYCTNADNSTKSIKGTA